MQVHIVSSFHYDYLYLQSSEEYFQISFRILDKALELLDKESEWCFTVEQVILLEEYLRRFPEKRTVMRRFAQEGRLSFAPGMYVMPDMNMIDTESLFLQAKYGKKFLRENFGTDAKVCWIADCWGHHAQLPQILKQCRYDGYFFWRCMRHDLEKKDFLWLGLDGSEIFVHWLATGYADISFPSDDAVLHAEELSFAAGTIEDIRRRLNKIVRYGESNVVLLCNGGDFRMPQSSAAEVLHRLNSFGDLPPMHFSTPEKFLASIDTAFLPSAAGEFNGAFQGCYSTNILIKQLLYYNREQLLANETFAALTGCPGVTDEDWKQLLRHFFHDTVCGTLCDEALQKAIFELKELRKVHRQDGEYLFNPILRCRHELFQSPDGKYHEITLAPLESARFTNFPVMPELQKEQSGGCFTNRFFCCSYEANGRITSLTTSQGRELVDASSHAWFGLPVMQMDYGDNWLLYESPLNGGCDAAAFTDNHPDPLSLDAIRNGLINSGPYLPSVSDTEIHRSDRMCRIILTGYLQFWRLRTDFTLTVTMDDLSPLLKFSLYILPTGKHYRLRAAFPTTLTGGTVHHSIPGGIQQRDNCEYPADGFMHLGNGRNGLFLLNRGIPGNNTDKNGVMLLSLFRSVAMEYKCASEVSFNRKVPHTFEYAVLPHDGEMYNAKNAAVIEKYLRPLQSEKSEVSASLPELPPDVRLFAMRKHPYGLFMRLGEVWGKRTVYDLKNPYVPADGLEEITASETTAPLDFRPFEIKNLVLIVKS